MYLLVTIRIPFGRIEFLCDETYKPCASEPHNATDMRENRLVYERNVTDIGSWSDFSPNHVAFALHRITGWLLLGWVFVHLGLPSLLEAPTAVYAPASKAVIVALFSVFLFHAFNGVRLLVAEFTGYGAGAAKRVFQGTLALALLFTIALGGLL